MRFFKKEKKYKKCPNCKHLFEGKGNVVFIWHNWKKSEKENIEQIEYCLSCEPNFKIIKHRSCYHYEQLKDSHYVEAVYSLEKINKPNVEYKEL